MKKLSLVLACLSMSILSHAQQKADVVNATPVPVIYNGLTGRLDQFVEAPGTVNEVTKTEKIGYHPKNDWVGNQFNSANSLPNGDDPVWQTDYAPPAPPTKAMGVGWNGMGYTGVNPADPSCDVGPNHVVQMINGSSGSFIQVYSKTGTPIGSQVYFDNFMGMPGGAGDPIVMYDERADRWFLSEFSASGNNLHIAISTTSDPGGTYHTYIFNSPGGFPDYPKYSIWENEYVMTANVNTPDIFAFNRADMLAGVATTAQMFSQSNFGTIGFQASTPVSMNGTVTPPAGQPALLMRMRDDAWVGSASDALEMWELDIDWTTPANSTLSQVQTLATAPHDSELCGYTSFQCFPQPGTGVTLDPLRELLMNRIHYRNFGTHESIVCCHVTDVNNTDRGGIRWYELRRTGGTSGSWQIYQQGTYSPDATNRWMPSISISASGNIGIAYSAGSNSVYPSLRYTGRKECDPLGTMTEPETVLAAGTASNASNRWGDYFQLNCDPSDGETFWHTGCFNTSAQWSTRVSSFDIATCSPQVSFANNAYSEDESNGVTTNPSSACLPFVDVIVPISIGNTPSQNADIVVSATGGTATAGVDFDLLNGTTTLNGSNLSSDVIVRIYNDALVEGNETIILTYTLNANGGDAVAGTINQSVTITINDDDLAPSASTITTTVLSENFESGFGGFSTVNNGTATATAWQVGNNAAASSGAYAIPTSNTTNFAWINDDACNCDQNDVDLIFPSIDLSSYTSAALTFETYFEDNTYQGNNEDADVYISINGGADVLVGALTPSVIDGNWETQNFDLTPYVGPANNNVVLKIKYSDGTGWLYGCTVDDVLVTGTGPIGIQTAINTGTGMTADLGPNETVHFYDPASGDVMLSLDNTSSFDYGCVTVEVDRPGTTPTAVQFNTTNIADYLHSKTFTIVPENTNPTGSYDVTLYYEEAEVAAWEAATGNSRTNAEIVKVDGPNQISDVTPATAASYTISSSAATVGAFGTDVTFTSSFSTGFSGFGVGIYNPAVASTPVADFSATPTTICANETVTFTDLSTNTPTSWSWDFGDGNTSTAQNPTHTYTAAGNYTVSLTATNASGSDVATQTNYITVNAIPSVVATGTATICQGQSTTIAASGATTYSWDNGAGTNATATVSPAATTTYTVTGTTNGCSATDQVTVTVNPIPLIASGTVTNPTACGSSTGSIEITGTGTGDIGWAGAANGSATGVTLPYTITGLPAGSYSIGFSAAGCNSNIVTVALVDPSAPTVTATGTATICEGQSTTITASGATTYSWDNGAGTNATATVSPTSTATYTVTGTTAGCTNTAQVTITVNPLPTVVATGTATICEGQSTTIAASGATTYSWDNGAGTNATATVSPTATTTYTVTGTTNGCSATDQVTVTVNPLPTVVATGTATICEGQSTTITASGATTYSWDNGAGTNATATVSPTATTTYTVTGTTNGCSAADQVTVTVNPLPVIASGTLNNPTACATSTGSIEITGTGTGDIAWTGGANGSATGVTLPYTITGLPAGSYSIVFNAAGCNSNTVTATLVDPSAPNVTATGTATICEGQSTTITASGATTYSWDNGAGTNATATVSPTSTTTYTVTGTTGGCTNTAQVTITVNPLPTVTATGTATICEGQSTTIAAAGATTYSWDNGAGTNATATVSPTATTTYTVTGTTNGCSATDQVTVTVNPLPTVTATGTATICEGQSTTITAAGATTYSWDNGAGTNATATVSPTSTTTYTVTGTTNGCSATDQVTITVNPIPVIASGTVNNPTACATSTGSIEITGTGTGDIAWTGGANGSMNGVTLPYTITGLPAGNYSIGFSAAGCNSNIVTATLVDPSAPNVTATGTATICEGQSTTITASGATTYSWDNGAGTNASATVSPTSTTTYTVTGSTGGCTNTAQVTVTVNPLPTVTATGTATICEGQSTTIASAGATTYSWDNGAGTNATATVSPTSTTTYTVTGTTNGCSATDQVTVTVNPLPTVTATGTATICEGQSTTIAAAGATTYSWDNGAGTNATATVSPTSTTTYTVTGTTNGCTATDQVTVTVNPLPTVTATGTATICEGQSTTIAAAGATTYSWDNGAGTNATAAVSPTSTTTYTVTGTTNGCSATDQVTVTVNPLPTVVATGTTAICEGGTATISATGATTYSWDNGAGTNATATVSPTSTTTYTVTGTTNGCSATDQVTVTVNTATSSTQDVEICEGSTFTVLGNTYTITGTYTDVTTNAAGCDSTITTNLTVNPLPTVSIEPTTIDTLCLSSDPITLVGTPGPGTFSGNGVSGGVFFPSTAGIGSHVITYTYTDGNGCTGTTTVMAIVDECTNSLNEVGLVGVSLFPNPNEGIFMISGLEIGTEYSIYDDRGRLVSKGTTEAEEQEVQLLDVQTGIYYLYATKDGQKGSLKFLVTK